MQNIFSKTIGNYTKLQNDQALNIPVPVLSSQFQVSL